MKSWKNCSSLTSSLLKFFITLLIKLYQLILSPYLGGNCRYYPSCSHYAIEAFEKKSVFEALYLTLKRILSCNPLGGKGYDPVPQMTKRNKINYGKQ
jgi:hypothetical protein